MAHIVELFPKNNIKRVMQFMKSSERQSGIEIIGPTSWGTHFCMFYQTQGDLIDILVPYFKAGLENNEYCMWVTSEPLNAKDAEKAMRMAIPKFDTYLQKNQIEIIPYTEWYLENNEFNSQRVLNGWVDKCNDALDKGFNGLRLTGNLSWLEDKNWKNFAVYEEEVNNVIPSYNMIALCTYSLEKYESFEILDVIRNHQYALYRREGTWEIFKSLDQIKIEQKLKESEERLKVFMESAPDTFMLYDSELNLININEIGVKRFPTGTKKEDVIGKNIIELAPDVKKTGRYDEYMEVIKTGKHFSIEEFIPLPKFGYLHFSLNAFKVLNGLGIIARDITERMKKEEKLKESEEKWRALSENSPAIILLCDREHKILFVNRTPPDFSKEEIIGTPAYNYAPKELRQITIDYRNSVWETGEPVRFYMNYTTKEGDVRYFDVWIGPVFQSGKVIALVSHHMDITEHQKLQISLQESEKRLLHVQEIGGLGFWDFNLITNELYWSDETFRIYGFKPQEFVPTYEIFRSIVHPDDLDYVQSRVDSALQDDIKYSIDFRFVRPNGEIGYIYVEGDVTRDEKGKAIRFVGTQMDITDRKKAEKDIMDLAKFPSENPNPILRATKEGILYVNNPGKLLFDVKEGDSIPNVFHDILNDSIELNENISKEIAIDNCIYLFDIIPIKEEGYANLYGKDITDRKKKEKEIFDLAQFPSENPHPVLRVNRNGVMYINEAGKKLLNIEDYSQIPKIFQRDVKEAFENNQNTESEVELDRRVYSFNITPIKDTGYVNIYGMDITERKQVEVKLREVNNLKTEFLRRASHELKTPLISIKGFSELILSLHEDQLEPSINDKLREINSGCERLQNIINNLLKTSKLESPELRPSKHREDLSFLINFCVLELESMAERRKQSIKLDIHNQLYAYVEKEEIHDVLSNLLSNAIKYTPPMGKIEIKTESNEDFVVVSVRDNGIGFTDEQKKLIFQQFGKIERYGQGLDLEIDGTGLGLFISKRIVESHGGKIWMESEGENMGSTFYFSLPKMIE